MHRVGIAVFKRDKLVVGFLENGKQNHKSSTVS